MFASTFVVWFLIAAGAPAIVPRWQAGQTSSQTALCTPAPRDGYGYTAEDPILVGGGVYSMVARERALLDSLRGPDGQPIQYQRLGQSDSSQKTILDSYRVTYPGLAKPIVLYLDAYRWSPPFLPRGFTCARAFPLSAPPPDPMDTRKQTVRTAVEYGRSRDLLPIPIDADGTITHGFALDHFRLVARLSRAASVAGTPLNPESVAPDMLESRMIVVAFPESCDGRVRMPRDLDILPGPQKLPSRREPVLISNDRLEQLLPGVVIPDGAIGAGFLIGQFRPQDAVKISYDSPCANQPADLLLPLVYTQARPVDTVAAAVPAGANLPSPPTVRITVTVGLDGTTLQAQHLSGTRDLVEIAVAAALQWKWDPTRVNGAPLHSTAIANVSFVKVAGF